jgi:hypothetical protein
MAHCDAQHLGSLAEPSLPPANDLQPHETSVEQPGSPGRRQRYRRRGFANELMVCKRTDGLQTN